MNFSYAPSSRLARGQNFSQRISREFYHGLLLCLGLFALLVSNANSNARDGDPAAQENAPHNATRARPKISPLSLRERVGVRGKWHCILARLTVYDAQSCPYGHQSATGVTLKAGRHCAVDRRRIPYGSRIRIPGLGERIAVDTGTDVVSRKAARRSGRNAVERAALVIDIFVDTRRDAARLDRRLPLFAEIQWREPESQSLRQR